MQYGEFSRMAYERSLRQDRIIKAQLELTYRCNLHCRHCYTDPYNGKEFFPRELTVTEIQRLLGEMHELGVVWLNLTGGDIFMHPDFFEIYEAANRQGFLLQLYTNGTLFTRAIIERLKTLPPFTIDISCHSVNEERFDWFTQVPGSYRAFMRGMTLLQESGLPFMLKTKLMDWNKDELGDIRAFTESFGQRFGYTTSLSPRLNGDCTSLAYRIDPQNLRRLEQADAPRRLKICAPHKRRLPSLTATASIGAGAGLTPFTSMPGGSSAPARFNTNTESPCGDVHLKMQSRRYLQPFVHGNITATVLAVPVTFTAFARRSRPMPDGSRATLKPLSPTIVTRRWSVRNTPSANL